MAINNDSIGPEKGWPTVQLIIQEKGDPLADTQVGVKDDERIVFIAPEKVFIKKGAMQSGKCSVTIYGETEQGEHIFFETSGNIMKMIASAVFGIDGI